MRASLALFIIAVSCTSGDDIDELFEPTCDDSIQYVSRVRLWLDGGIIDQIRPGLRLRGDPKGEALEPVPTEDPIAIERGYLIEFHLSGDREYQELEFSVDDLFAAEVIAGGLTSAASYCNDADDRGADQMPQVQIVHSDVVLDQL